ncbi:MAG: thermonuclease family protein [Verrucomicrobia bacterium]|nr:thermonuclease family protein [Verrucomicrobiota bacterium]
MPSRLTILVLVWALLLSLFPSLAAERKRPAATPKWDVLYGCRLLRESHRDGDSFHVSVGRREYIFRLYFVDAPETDTSFLDRNREQCEYFGVSERELRKAAEAARQVTADLLQKPFVVTTRWQNAMGRSVLPRYYGMVEIGGKDLAAILVSRGLARAKGKTAILPNGESAKAHMENFRRLEAAAKIKRLGIWASSTKP